MFYETIIIQQIEILKSYHHIYYYHWVGTECMALIAWFANCGFQFHIKLCMPKQKELQRSVRKRGLANVKADKERSTFYSGHCPASNRSFFRTLQILWNEIGENGCNRHLGIYRDLRRLFKRKVTTRRNWIRIKFCHWVQYWTHCTVTMQVQVYPNIQGG